MHLHSDLRRINIRQDFYVVAMVTEVRAEVRLVDI